MKIDSKAKRGARVAPGARGARPARQSARRERERERHRGEILGAAERVFTGKGFDRATMEEVAREADYSVGALYNFFRSKDDLCGAVLRRIVEDVVACGRDILSIEDPLAALDRLVEVRLDHMERHGPFVRMVFERGAMGEAERERTLRECMVLFRSHLKQVADILARGVRLGVIRPINPLHGAVCLEGVIHAFSAQGMAGGEFRRETLAQRAAAIRETYLDLLKTESRTDKGDSP